MRDEASRVVPLFQMAPVFSYALAWVFLHEQLTQTQGIAAVVIIIASIAINLDLDNQLRFKKTVFWLMMLAAGLFATEGFLFKYGATNYDFWDGVFYQYAGMALAGLGVALASKKFRDNFAKVFRANTRSILTISLFNEVLAIGAFMTYNYATLLAPLTLVTIASINTQPFFVILFGIILTLFFPKLGKETIGRKHLVQKIICIAVVFLGSYVLVR
jgi:drug/metabolite transporter (DMT)-like permease